MDARVSELFCSGNGHGAASQGVASNGKPGNGYPVAPKKACVKNNKKAKARFPRNFKPSNNTPYLPPEAKLVYQIGVEDNGMLVGLSEEDMRASLKTLHKLAEKIGADITVLREQEVDYDSDEPHKIAEVLIRKVPDDQQFLDLRVAVLGNVDSGKSTLLGVLTQGVNYSESRTAEEICESASKMITFIDLAGHHKYLKTTIFGLTSYCPDFAILVVSANTGIAGTTREHLGLAMALKVPIFIVVSKVDLCTRATVERTVRQLERVLKQPGCNKVPMVVSSMDDAVTAAQQFAQTPSVSGESLDLLKVFFNIIPPLSNSKEQEELMQQLTEFQVDEIYTVPEVGTVVGGTLYSGICREGDHLVVGPTDSGQFHKLTIGSIQRNRSACRVLKAGQAATLALGDFDRSLLRKGMVMVSPEMNPTICWTFEAEIVLLFHAKTFHKGFQVTVHIGNVRQTATVEAVYGKEELRTGEKAVVLFKFIKHPEYLKVGAKVLFREGLTKGIGHVTKLQPNPPSQSEDDDA
ncbi:GTP-binding protein 2 [Nibea albiflora]|uniref:GTP-binding protein 2 n=1 Tax=Nibea albiflora TaxID=240163 RepID=A0ACB7EDI5_NIBAL|nr:GTP-binding protein 2 [Nibea albiflora]